MEKEKKHRTSSDEMLNASYEYNEVSYKYDAFISYRHVEPDQTVAKYVHQMIETFKAPKEFYKDGKRPVFKRPWRIDRRGTCTKQIFDSHMFKENSAVRVVSKRNRDIQKFAL